MEVERRTVMREAATRIERFEDLIAWQKAATFVSRSARSRWARVSRAIRTFAASEPPLRRGPEAFAFQLSTLDLPLSASTFTLHSDSSFHFRGNYP